MQKFLQDVNIGANLKKLREKKNLSQNDMAVKLQLAGRSMSRAQYAHIEQGRRNIFVSDLILFKQILNVNYEDFFRGLSPSPREE
ncbi:helix-turn-helix domain-containing protein [Acetivibrio sp. MSJd-27]|uniref:helix-turn-helix domain-containing protein n=1 Tax=Acetivibrio sp. MSJd-27 TaxID=2841523 RepID=UPI0015A792A4|nr:helix-turn-helix transcriptional regulator [Acetivibrio sp. MSJd-27]MBU5449065.1 helix-turn-helix domain-containing protein [Acetivibrio sp. MSJd-27]